MSQPLVSILTTVYNREKFLPTCFASVLASTFKEYEYIIVDDHSDDASYDLALNLAKSDSRVRVYRNDANLGDYPNRNRAASYAAGKYLKYIDADDCVYPHGIGLLVQSMESFPDAGWGLASLEPDKERPFPFHLSPREAYRRHYFGQPLFEKAPLSAIIRRDVFTAVGGFSGRRYVGDFELWHILGARFPVVLMPQGVVWYREHEQQEMQLNRNSTLIRFGYLEVSMAQLSAVVCPLTPGERERAVHNLRRNQARAILKALSRGEVAVAAEMFRRSGLGLGRLLTGAFSIPKVRASRNPV
jgi:glycosyltransferase involved in cell wall biosynthesis